MPLRWRVAFFAISRRGGLFTARQGTNHLIHRLVRCGLVKEIIGKVERGTMPRAVPIVAHFDGDKAGIHTLGLPRSSIRDSLANPVWHCAIHDARLNTGAVCPVTIQRKEG